MSYERLAKKQKSNSFNTAVSQSKPRHREFPYRPPSPMMPHPNNTGMPEPVRTQMEAAFDTDFSNVTIHPNSSKAAKLDALAYTRGHDIHFAPGTYNPGSDSGRRLLGHELAHVVQQREGRVHPNIQMKGLKINDDEGLEKEADVKGNMVRGTVDSYAPGKGITTKCSCPSCTGNVSSQHLNGTEMRSSGFDVIQCGKKNVKGNKGAGLQAQVGRRSYQPTQSRHAEELILQEHRAGDLTIEMNAWPCMERCHNLLLQASRGGRTITVEVTGDQGGYARDHGRAFGATGTITYQEGHATYA